MKKLSGILLIALLSFSVANTNVSATSNEYLWDESTNKVLDSAIKNEEPKLDASIEYETPMNGIRPRMLMETLVRYDQTSASINYKKKYVGQTRVDNSQNKYTSAKLIYKATASGSWSIEANSSLETKAEVNLILAKVDATVTVGGSATRSWSNGTEYGTETDVPAGRIGTVSAYIPGTSSLGKAVYKITNDSSGDTWYESRSRGAVIPAKNSWNFVVSIQ